MPIGRLRLFAELTGSPVFTLETVNRYCNSASVSKAAIQELIKAGMVRRIRSGMYTCVCGRGGAPMADRFHIASILSGCSYISHRSAVEYYGAYENPVHDVYVSSETPFDEFEFDGYRYRYIRPSITLGVRKAGHNNLISVTDRERTVLDSIKDMYRISGHGEVIAGIEAIKSLREDKMLEYLEAYDDAFLYQKTGFILESVLGPIRNRNDLSERFFDICNKKSGETGRFLTGRISPGIYAPRWRLYIPYDFPLPIDPPSTVRNRRSVISRRFRKNSLCPDRGWTHGRC